MAKRRVFCSVRRVSAALSCCASQLPLGLVARLAFLPQVAAGADHAAEHVVRQFDATHVEAFFDAQQAAVDQLRQRVGRGTGREQRLGHALLGQALAVARFGQQFVLDHAPHARRLVRQRALVELRQDRVARAGQQVGGDLRLALRLAHRVELAADQAQQRRLDFRVLQLRTAGDEAHDRLRHLLRHQPAARLEHGGERLRAGHARQPHAVLRDRRHHALHALEVRQVVLAQRDQDAVVGAGEIEVVGGRIVAFQAPLERVRRPVLDQVGQFLDEFLRPAPARVVGLRQREDLLELVEDQQRQQRLAVTVAQQVAAMVQELPQRLALDRRAGARPVPRLGGHLEDGLLDLLGRRRRVGRVVDADVDRAEALAAQPRHQAGAQQRGLAEAGLAEQDGQQLALHAPREFRGLVVAAVEIGARVLVVARQADPGILRIDRTSVDSSGRRELMSGARSTVPAAGG